MAGSSVQTTLGDLVVFRSGGTPSKAEPEYWEGTIPWVSAKDMKAFRLFDVQDHISDDGLAAGSRIAPAGSVLLLTRGMTLLSDIPICVVDRPMAFNQDVKALEAGPRLDSAYLPYLLLGRKHELLASLAREVHAREQLVLASQQEVGEICRVEARSRFECLDILVEGHRAVNDANGDVAEEGHATREKEHAARWGDPRARSQAVV